MFHRRRTKHTRQFKHARMSELNDDDEDESPRNVGGEQEQLTPYRAQHAEMVSF